MGTEKLRLISDRASFQDGRTAEDAEVFVTAYNAVLLLDSLAN